MNYITERDIQTAKDRLRNVLSSQFRKSYFGSDSLRRLTRVLEQQIDDELLLDLIVRQEGAQLLASRPRQVGQRKTSIRRALLKSVPRTSFSQGALYEIGSAMSLFQIKTYADEFIAAIEGKAAPKPVVADETVAQVSEDVEETTRDFILKRLAQDFKGHPLAAFVAHLLNAMGYRTRVSPEGPDGGIDIVAHKDDLGFEPPIVKVQVKAGTGKVETDAVSALYGRLAQGEFGLFVTLGLFTPAQVHFAKSKSNLRIIDGEALVDLIFQNYERFDAKYKGLLPLRRVYVPEPLEED